MLQSLEDGVVNETVLSLAGLQSWHSLSYGRFQVGDSFTQMELCLQPDLIKKWKRSSKKWAAEAMSKGEQFDPSSSPEANFVRGLTEEFVEVLDHGVFADEVDDIAVSQLVDDSSVLYCERFMEFLIDMLNQLPTRRYISGREEKPASVTAEVTFSIKSYRTQIRSEWNSIKEHDVLFLLCIRPSFEPLGAEEAAKATVPQRLGLQYVRGCEVIDIRDEEGNLMNDFTGRVKRDEWKPPKGEMRTVTVALDAAQYHIDVTDIAEKGAEDVYGTFNVLMRRKPKENNFKAILDSRCMILVASFNQTILAISLQVGAIISGIQPGLTMVVGPPGTGKTDTAVQILNVLYHNCPSQRTLIITHSNQALNDLFEKIMEEAPIFHRANAGFSYEYQLINVPDYEGRGESTPSPWFYQNQGEAEYIVSVYIYMRLLGYPANKISILTTYNGQKLLIRDVINRRCVPYSFIGPPSKVTTVDKFQGQQNDFILLSLVRTRFVGHLRDVRRLVVALSRARLGLYVFCRRSLFEQCYELQPTFQLLLKRPDRLGLNLSENTSAYTDRAVDEVGNPYLVHDVEEMAHIVNDRMNEFYKVTTQDLLG
ncbi:hypothetical protein Bca4012_081742 [Brassica carinata]